MTRADTATLFELTAPLVATACSAIMDVYERGAAEVTSKADDSPLTEADRRSHQIFAEGLRDYGLPILSEEGKTIPYEQRRGWQRFWLVDPLDGTKEFINHNGEFTVNVALIDDNTPVWGIVAVPVGDAMYFGARGVGAYRGALYRSESGFSSWTAQSERLNPVVLPQPASAGELRIVASRSHANSDTNDFIQTHYGAYSNVEIVAAGSSLKFCRVAEGLAHVYPRIGPTMEWDTAAGQAVVEAAGGSVTQVLNGNRVTERLQYNRQDLLNPYFLVRGIAG